MTGDRSGLEVSRSEASREVRRGFFYLKAKDGGMIPATLMDLIWVEQVWRENQHLWIDHVLSLRFHYISM